MITSYLSSIVLCSLVFIQGVTYADKLNPNEHQRHKRSALSVPNNTTCLIRIDLSFTVTPMEKLTSTYLTIDIPFLFVMPTYDQLVEAYSQKQRLEENAIDLDYEFLEEQRSNEERRFIYKTLEAMIEKFGFDGNTCVKRAICELADAPLAHNGLIGRLVHLFFTPTIMELPKKMADILKEKRNHREFESLPEWDLLEKPVQDEYTDAFRHGKEGKCWARYFACPFSVFQVLDIK